MIAVDISKVWGAQFNLIALTCNLHWILWTVNCELWTHRILYIINITTIIVLNYFKNQLKSKMCAINSIIFVLLSHQRPMMIVNSVGSLKLQSHYMTFVSWFVNLACSIFNYSHYVMLWGVVTVNVGRFNKSVISTFCNGTVSRRGRCFYFTTNVLWFTCKLGAFFVCSMTIAWVVSSKMAAG